MNSCVEKVLSYGGHLNFTQRYLALPNYPPSFDTDVIIVGPSSLSISWTNEELLSPNQEKARYGLRLSNLQYSKSFHQESLYLSKAVF